MDWTTILLIVVAVALLSIVLRGGVITVKPGSIKFDIKGLLNNLNDAAREKGIKTGTSGLQSEHIEKQLNSLSRQLPAAKLLWVDDHPINNQRERMALASIGIFADSYVNNAEALQAFQRDSYAIVISDVGRDASTETGWDLARVIRQLNSSQIHLKFSDQPI